MTEEEKVKAYNKWKSRRWVVTVWSMAMISIFAILGIVFKIDSFVTLCSTLSVIPIGFVSLETVNKWKKQKEVNTEENLK